MKKRLGFVIAMILFVTAPFYVTAQEIHVKYEPVKFQKILDQSFVPSLESDIPGIVEGSIYNIVLCRKYFSTLDYSATTEKLKWLIAKKNSSPISYKAHLALMYLTNADDITITPKSDPETHDYLFRQLSNEFETKMLVSNEVLTKK